MQPNAEPIVTPPEDSRRSSQDQLRRRPAAARGSAISNAPGMFSPLLVAPCGQTLGDERGRVSPRLICFGARSEGLRTAYSRSRSRRSPFLRLCATASPVGSTGFDCSLRLDAVAPLGAACSAARTPLARDDVEYNSHDAHHGERQRRRSVRPSCERVFVRGDLPLFVETRRVASSSAIEWTEATWNPVTGCDRVSPGCAHWYALDLAARLKRMGQAKYQRDGERRSSGPASA